MLLAVSPQPGASLAQGPATEYEIKAAFLYNFAQFVEWPPNAGSKPTTPFIIGIFGEDPFGVELDRAIRGETVNGRPIVIKRFARVQDLEFCHMLFIRAAESVRLGSILDAVQRWGVLTVGESPHFTEIGGMMNFTLKGNLVRFEINVGAAERAGLRISSKLLHLAESVREARAGTEP